MAPPQDGWLVVDYGSIVVHLFAPDLRKYYRLEDLWHEGKVLLHTIETEKISPCENGAIC
ncbi:MAG: RsfS/YbeB/iojap family protein [Chloroflexota bacterium]